MFSMPSMWNLVVSTIVFFVAAWYIHHFLDEQGIPKGMTRGLLVFTLALIVSQVAGVMVDWTHDKIAGPQPVAQASSASTDNLSQLLKAAGQEQPPQQ